MEELKSWGLLLLFVSIGSLIYCFLLPGGAVSKTAKAVISIALMSLVFSPLFSVAGNISGYSFDFPDSYESEDYSYYVKEQARLATEAVIGDTVRKFTSVPYKTEIFININADNSIDIEYVGITFSAKPQHEKELIDALSEALGIIPHIKVDMTDD